MRTLYLLAIALLLGVTGCNGDDRQRAEFVPSYVSYQIGPGRRYVQEFMLADGTRCVTYNDVTLTCEWHTPVVLVPRPQ